MNHDKAIKEILDGIDRDEVDGGWWETSAGVEFGEKKQEELLAYVRQLIEKAQRVDALEKALALALRFCPSGAVPEGLSPEFYHTLNYKDECELHARLDEARELLK